MARSRVPASRRASPRTERSRLRALALAISLALVGSLGAPLTAGASPGGSTTGLARASTVTAPCGTVPAPGHAMCLIRVPKPEVASQAIGSQARVTTLTTLTTDWPTALHPGDVISAYGWQSSDHTTGKGKTIALVDAYNDPTIATDLATFSAQFALPPCTTANGCFTKVDQTGGATYPAKTTAGWDGEISLDVEWAHAMAPDARILLVEATTASLGALFAAVQYAAAHAQYVSMSWIGTEFTGEASYDSLFTAHAATDSYFAAAGDTAQEVGYPSASPDVVSVGGTRLDVTFTPTTRTTANWVGESGWSTGGGGCSAYEPAAAAQAGFPAYGRTGVPCGTSRGMPDVSADATPATGVAIYDSQPLTLTTPSQKFTGWFQFGGTSLASPLWAGHAAADAVHVTATYLYGRNIPFYNVNTSTGGNGWTCVPGYNLCEGLGSWSTSQGTLNELAPSAPANLRAAGTTATSVSLAWTAPSATGGTPIDHYLVYETGTLLATLGTTLAYSATGLAASTTYHFIVRAENSTGTSTASDTLAVTTTTGASSPVGFTASGSGTGYVTVGTIAPLA